jgi:hypothetical protein
MARGMRIPVGVNMMGGAAMVEGEDNDRKTIFAAMSGCDNDHAFQQDLGMDMGVVFQTMDSGVRAKALRRLRDIFRQFEEDDRYRLLNETVKWSVKEGELILEFNYLNIETDQIQSFSRTYSTGVSGTKS